ncbi:phosphopantetheine-binding protein [uncultured Acetatifactor sp.]|uniref:phosphopantetheine-binding protein n=1 Tax=uncultured Acetatifactor sp. TaxID=1671927 RepID=UPI00261CE90C|nr:phosphopantetheine-binding protein [uncultured Acetatifactor sp.]
MEFEAAARRIMEVINEVTHHADGLNLTSKIKSLGVTSLNFMKVILDIEEVFHIRFRDEDINPSKFDTIEKIADLVIKYQGEMDASA